LIQKEFPLDIFVFIPLITLLVAMIILKKTIIKGIFYSLIATVLLLIFISKIDLLVIIETAFMGYTPTNNEIERLVSGSGLLSMFDIFYIILISTAFNGILEGTQLIKPLLDIFKTGIKSPAHLMHRSGILSVLVTTITCNQTLTAIITGNTFKELYKKNNITTTYLARSISDFGMIMVPIIPWNVNAILVKSLTGVSATQYAPLSFFPLFLPIMGFIYPYMLNRKLKLITQADDLTIKNVK
jgi:NhaC family Na+:H+ antiporter